MQGRQRTQPPALAGRSVPVWATNCACSTLSDRKMATRVLTSDLRSRSRRLAKELMKVSAMNSVAKHEIPNAA